MSDSKEKDELPQNFAVDMAPDGNRTAPDAAVSVPQQTEQPKTGDGSVPPVVVKQDVLKGESVAPMEISKATADGSGVGAETEAPAEAVGGEKGGVEAETETPAEAAKGCKIGNISVDNGQGSVQDAGTAEKQEEIKSQSQLSSGAESLDAQSVPDDKVAQARIESAAVQSIPDDKVAKIESAAVQSVPDDKVTQIESSAVQSGPDETVVKSFITASETLVEPLEPASDTVTPGSKMPVETAEPTADTKPVILPVSENKADTDGGIVPAVHDENIVLRSGTPEVKAANGELGEDIKNQLTAAGEEPETMVHGMIMSTPVDNGNSLSKLSFLLDDDDVNESGSEEDQAAFMKELENFFRERTMEFKPPKFYGEGLNCLKLWRAVMRLGGYDKVTSCKLWRQVGESFRPPKTCTTVSWTFRGFYEKALLDYERHKVRGGEVALPNASRSEPAVEHQGSGSGRARRDAAARAMQGWHSQRLLGNGEVSDPVIKDKTPLSLQKREKQLSNIGLLKRKKPSYVDSDVKLPRTKASKTQLDISVADIGPPADWVKINVQRTKDCFEVYALVPGLLREEVRVQSDPAGRLVISGEPEHPDNPWGVTPFKKVINLPSRIDPHQTSAVVTLHGQLFVRVPLEQSD